MDKTIIFTMNSSEIKCIGFTKKPSQKLWLKVNGDVLILYGRKDIFSFSSIFGFNCFEFEKLAKYSPEEAFDRINKSSKDIIMVGKKYKRGYKIYKVEVIK